MAAHNSYVIIDEPKTKRWDYLIVNPLLILLAAIFLPLFWNPPFYGRFWMPMAWLMVNSWLLGSPSFFRELFYAVGGMLMLLGIVLGFGYAINNSQDLTPFYPYVRIVLQAQFFLALYLIVFKQSVPYELFVYLKSAGMAR